MAGNDVVLVGTGSMTAVGLSAPETATSVASDLSNFEECAILDRAYQPFVVAAVPEEGLPPLADRLQAVPLTGRERRLLRLATAPLKESVAGLGPDALPVGFHLALPAAETQQPLDGDTFLRWLAAQVPDVIDLQRSVAPFRGRAGGLVAVARAADAIRNGQRDFVLVGGIDSYRDPFVLSTLDRAGRVKSERVMDGFIPGEGAAFVLLASRSAAEANRLAPLGTLGGWVEGFEPGHLHSKEPYRGDGLANAFRSLFQSARPPAPVSKVYSSMNGESHWAKEWGVAYLRNSDAISDDVELHHPADCVGDVGAAAGPLLLGLACGADHDGSTLVYASSDRGERGSVLLTR